MISFKTPQDDATIFTQQQLWHLNGGTVILRVLLTKPGHINQLICALSVCVYVCVYERETERERVGLLRKKMRRWQRGFFDPSESEEGIKLPVPLSEVTIPRSGVQFPSSVMVCMSVFQRRCANLEPSPRRLDMLLDSCVEQSHSCRGVEGVEGQWGGLFVVRQYPLPGSCACVSHYVSRWFLFLILVCITIIAARCYI